MAGAQFWQGWAGGSQGRRPPRPRLLAGVLILAMTLVILFVWSWRGLAGVLILAGVALAALVVLWVVPSLLVPPIPEQELPPKSERKDRLDAIDARLGRRNDLRNGLLQTLVVVGVLAGAWLGFQQLTDARDKAADDRNKAIADRELTRQGQASERFTRAISQLGDKRVETRIGGIYGLAQVAAQAPENNGPVGEVLLAYINRLPRPSEPAKPSLSDSAKPSLSEEAPDVQAALTVLTQFDRDNKPGKDYAWLSYRLDLHDLNLRGADLRSANLRGARLLRADLTEAKLSGANLSRTDLSLHRNSGVPLDVIPTTDLRGAQLRYADLRGANLTGVDLTGADLTGADLERANLSGANFNIADLSSADLHGANLHGANFVDADLRGADLRDAELTAARLDEEDDPRRP